MGGYNEDRRCELNETVRGCFDFEFAVSYFVDEVSEGARGTLASDAKSLRVGRLVAAC
jgi:hypothetical protein